MSKILRNNIAIALLAFAGIALVAVLVGVATATIANAATFDRSLKLGMSGSDVMELQKFLNTSADTQVASSGAGSPGNETSYFGSLTRAAVIKWQNKYASEVLAPVGLSSGTGYFGPSSRAKANAMGGAPVSTGGLPTGCTSTAGYSPVTGQKCDAGVSTIPSVGGALSVGAAAQPANGLAPEGAARVPFTRVTLTAGSNDVTVTGITVERAGAAQDAVFAGVVLLDENGVQLGIAKTLNSNHQATVGDPFVVRAGTSRTMTIAGNMTSDLTNYAGQVAAIQVNAVNTSGTVSGSLPIIGAYNTINASLTIGTAQMAVSSFDPDSAQTKEIGTSAYKFAGVRITAGSTEQVRIKSLRWNQTGSAGSGDLANVMTYIDGTAYPTTVSSDGKYYTAVLGSGIVIDKGLSKDFYVQGDVVGTSAAGRTVQFDIYKSTDVNVAGETYGYGITPTAASTGDVSTASEFTTGTPFFSGSTVTVSAGSVTSIAKATAVAAQNIAVNVPNQVLGGYEADIKGEAISVQSQVFWFTSSSAAGANLLTSVSLYGPNGQVVAGPVDAVDVAGTNQKVTFTDTVTYPVGKGAYTLKGKVDADITNDTTIIASTTPSSDWTSITGQTTGNTISLTGAGLVTMNTMTVKSASLAITLSSSPAAQTIVAGGQGVTFANYQLDASQSGEDVRFSSVQLTLAKTGASSLYTHLTSCQLWDGSTALNTGSNSVNPDAATETFTFDSMLQVSKGTIKTLALKCNVSSAASGTFQWGVTTSATNPTVTGVTSSNSVTATGGTLTGQILTIGTGSLAISTDSSSPSYQSVAAGSSNVTLGVLKLRASNEDMNLTKLGLKLTNTASSSSSDLVTVSLWDGGTQVGSATFTGSNTAATSTLTSYVLLPKDTDKQITIKGNLSQIGSSQPVTVSGHLVAVDYNNSDPAGTVAIGVGSGTEITETGSSAVSGVRIFKSVPTFALDTVSGTGVADGVLMKFKVTASANGPVGINKFVLGIATTSATVSAVNIFAYEDAAYSSAISGVNSGGQLANSNASVTGVTGSQTATITADTAGTATAVQVPAGTTRYFKVTATVAGVTTGSSVSTTLKADTSYPSLAASNFTTTVGGLSSFNMIWSPNSTTTANVTTDNDWVNAYNLPGLPASGLIQTRSN